MSHLVSQVCDSIMNIGPCGTVVMGEPAFLSEEFNHIGEHDIELVSTSGYAKNGALSVLQVLFYRDGWKGEHSQL